MTKPRRNWRKLLVVITLMVIVNCVLTACTMSPTDRNPYNVKVIDHTADFYVNDFAGILSDEQKSDMMTRAIALEEEHAGIQVVVTTVESFEKTVVSHTGDASANVYDIEQLSYAMFSQYGIGQDDMGILIFFSVEDREVRIETGYQMQNYITDQKSGQLLDKYGMEYFRNNQFAEGIVAVQDATINEIKLVVPTTWSSLNEVNDSEQEVTDPNTNKTNTDEVNESNNTLLWGFFGSIGAMFVTLCVFIRNLFTSKKKSKAEAETYARNLKAKDDKYNQDIERLKKAHSNKMEEASTKCKAYIAKKQQEFDSLKQQLSVESNKHGDTKRELAALQEKFRRIQELHPEYDFEQEVFDMVESEYKAEAESIDKKLASALTTEVSKDRIDFFTKTKGMFFSTGQEVRKYLTTDIKVIESKLRESVALKKEYDRAEKEKQDKAVALAMQHKLSAICEENPVGNYSNYSKFKEVYELLIRLTSEQKEFLSDDDLVKRFYQLCEDANVDYSNYFAANKVNQEIKKVISQIIEGKEEHLDVLERTKRRFTELKTAERVYVNRELMSKLNKLIDEAEADQERNERERKRKRMQNASRSNSYSSRSSFASHSSRTSYSGNGGRPSGGGASRKF